MTSRSIVICPHCGKERWSGIGPCGSCGSASPGDFVIAAESKWVCPFCREEFFGGMLTCGGSFLDRDHPASVRPVLVEFENGRMPIVEEARLAQQRATYRVE